MFIKEFSTRITALPWIPNTLVTDEVQRKINSVYAYHASNNFIELFDAATKLAETVPDSDQRKELLEVLERVGEVVEV